MNSSFWLIIFFYFTLLPREIFLLMKNDSNHSRESLGKTQICVSHDQMFCHQYQYFPLNSWNKSSIHGSPEFEQKVLKIKYFAKIAQSQKCRLEITWHLCAYDVRSMFDLFLLCFFNALIQVRAKSFCPTINMPHQPLAPGSFLSVHISMYIFSSPNLCVPFHLRNCLRATNK